jgi:PST family polysaccharide transporter
MLNAMGWLYITSGRPDRLFRLGVATSIALVAGFAIALPWGPQTVAWSFSLVVGVSLVPAINHACRGTSVRANDILGAMLAPFTISAVFAGVAVLTQSWADLLFETQAFAVLTALGLGSVLTICCAILWPRSRRELTQLAASWRGR